MKKTILLATTIAAGTAAFIYFFKKRTAPTMQLTKIPEKKSHHITDIFAKAKVQE